MNNKRKFLTSLLCILFLASFALLGTEKILDTPHPFYDAQILAKCFEEISDKEGNIKTKFLIEKKKIALAVLSKYLKISQEDTSSSSDDPISLLKDNIVFKDNPFLQKYCDSISLRRFKPYEGFTGLALNDFTIETSANKVGKGFLSPVMVADALGTIIAERFKEELTIAYLDKFREEVVKSQLRPLFPLTADFLLNSNLFDFKLFLPTLKDAFENDLKGMDGNLKNFLVEYKEDLGEKQMAYFKDKIEKLKANEVTVIEEDFKKCVKDFNKEIKCDNYKFNLPDNTQFESPWICKRVGAVKVKITGLNKEIEKLKQNKTQSAEDKKKIKTNESDLAHMKDLKNALLFLKNRKKVISGLDLTLLEQMEPEWISDEIKVVGKKKNKLAELKKIQKAVKNKDVLNFAIVILGLVEDIRDSAHAVEVINNIGDKDSCLWKIESQFATPLKIFTMISRNLENKTGDGWLTLEDFKEFLKPGNEQLLEIYAGLVYAREVDNFDRTYFGKGCSTKTLKKIIDDVVSKNPIDIEKTVRTAISHIENVKKVVKRIDDKIAEFKKIKNDGKEIGADKYFAYMKTFFDMVDIGVDLEALNSNSEMLKGINENLERGRKLLAIAKFIEAKSYGLALVNVLDLLKDILPEESDIKKGLLKYGTFMVNLVQAKDTKQLQGVLEAAVLPVQSYRLKRTSHFNISLNAYPGFFVAGERLTTDEEHKGVDWAVNLGFTAPVGLALSWGEENKADKKVKSELEKIKMGPSHTIFLSAIDIGAVVNYRLTSANTGLPEFEWKNILAPGLYYILGFRNSPLSLGVGIQYGPQLRKIEALETTGTGTQDAPDVVEPVIDSSAFRIGLIFTVDIPLFNIHSKKEK